MTFWNSNIPVMIWGHVMQHARWDKMSLLCWDESGTVRCAWASYFLKKQLESPSVSSYLEWYLVLLLSLCQSIKVYLKGDALVKSEQTIRIQGSDRKLVDSDLFNRSYLQGLPSANRIICMAISTQGISRVYLWVILQEVWSNGEQLIKSYLNVFSQNRAAGWKFEGQ